MTPTVHIGPTVVAEMYCDTELMSYAERVARVTRRGYRRPEPLAGLPAPDGAFEQATDVLDDLARGGRVTLARVGDVDAGAVRVLSGPDGERRLRRLAVDPTYSGLGIGERLLRYVEAEAGGTAVCLDAVVERCVPPFYARLGYQTIAHWPSPDKPLTEVTMCRKTGRPATSYAHPWQGDRVAPVGGVVVCYFRWRTLFVAAVTATGGRCAELAREQAARVGQALGFDPNLRCVGADHVPAQARSLVSDLRHRASGVRQGLLLFTGPPATVPPYLAPRMVAPRALALWRMPDGARVPGHG